MTIDIDKLKAEFRAKATARGIDVQEGATAYQVANIKAAQAKASHTARMNALVYADAVRRVPRNTAPMPEDRPTPEDRYPDGRGGVDWVKVERQASRAWWVYPPYWVQGSPRLMTITWQPTPEAEIQINGEVAQRAEVEAIRNVKREAIELEHEGLRRNRYAHRVAFAKKVQAASNKAFRALVREVLEEEMSSACV